MAKKQCRYYSADLEKVLPKLIGETVNLILQDGQVHYLKLVRFTENQLVAVDGTNRTHSFPLHLMEEVIAEKHA